MSEEDENLPLFLIYWYQLLLYSKKTTTYITFKKLIDLNEIHWK